MQMQSQKQNISEDKEKGGGKVNQVPSTEAIRKAVSAPPTPRPEQDTPGQPEGYVMLFSPYPVYCIYLEKSRKVQSINKNGETVTSLTPGRVIEFKRHKALVPEEDAQRLRKFNRRFGTDFCVEDELRVKLLGPGQGAEQAERLAHRRWVEKYKDIVQLRNNWHYQTRDAEFFSILEERNPLRVGKVRTYGAQAGVESLPEGW